MSERDVLHVPRLNDDRRRRFGETGRMLALVCECGDPDCRRAVLLSPEEYDALRPNLVLHAEHGHFVPDATLTRRTV